MLARLCPCSPAEEPQQPKGKFWRTVGLHGSARKRQLQEESSERLQPCSLAHSLVHRDPSNCSVPLEGEGQGEGDLSVRAEVHGTNGQPDGLLKLGRLPLSVGVSAGHEIRFNGPGRN